MRIQTNIAAYNTQRQLSINNNKKTKSLEKISSGQRVNRAADDAAGLSISEKMRAQIRGMSRASRNVQDGVSLLSVADAALQTCNDIIARMRELAVQAASDTNCNEIDREALNLEYQQLKEEIDDIARNTNFNGIKLLDGSVASLKLAGLTLDVDGLHDYTGTQAAAKTVVKGIDTAYVSSTRSMTKYSSSISVTTPGVATTNASGTVSTNGSSLYSVLALGPDPAYAGLQGRTDAALTAIKASGNLTVTNNEYTGLVTDNDGSGTLTVTNNSGFVYNNGDVTKIDNNYHTGQVQIDSKATATATIGTNNGGEIQVGTIDSLTVTNNSNFSGTHSQSYDYIYSYVYHFADGTNSSVYGTYYSTDDRVNTSSRPQYDGNGFSDGISGVLQPDGVTYIYNGSASGSIGGKQIVGVTYTYVLQHPAEYTEPKTGASAYNYAYNTYWDESQQGQILSDAVKNTVTSNAGLLDTTNTSASSKTTVTTNSGTIYAASRDVDIVNNSGTIYAKNQDTGSTFDLTGTNNSSVYVWSETANINQNSYYVTANASVKTLTVTTNTYMGSYSTTNSNIGNDGYSTSTSRYYIGIISSAAETNIGTNSGSALIEAGKLTVTTNSGFVELKSGASVKDIGANTGTVVLNTGVNVDDWNKSTNGVNNNGTIQVNGLTVPPLTVKTNTGTVKAANGAKIEFLSNAGVVEISGGRIGGMPSTVTIGNNSGTIRNGGELEITGTNTGTIDNYGKVTGSGLAGSTTIRHFATNLDTSGVTFPTGIDFSTLTMHEINEILQQPGNECTITFKANGETFTLTANWVMKNVQSLSCACDETVDVCDPNSPVVFDAFELVFDLQDAALVSSEGHQPASFDGGYVVLSENVDMITGKFPYTLEDIISVSGETGKVGTKLTFSAGLDGTYTAHYEQNDGLILQSGANEGDITPIYIESVSSASLGEGGCLGCPCGTLGSTVILTHETAQKAIAMCTAATENVSKIRGDIGAMQNRLEYKINNLDVSTENLMTAESRIRDTDIAKEMTAFVRQSILSQASTGMLSLANGFPSAVLQLL